MRAQWLHTSPFQAAVFCHHENISHNRAEFEEHLLMKETYIPANQNASIKCFKVIIFWLWINWIFYPTSSLSHKDSGTHNAHEIYSTWSLDQHPELKFSLCIILCVLLNMCLCLDRRSRAFNNTYLHLFRTGKNSGDVEGLTVSTKHFLAFAYDQTREQFEFSVVHFVQIPCCSFQFRS